MKRFARRRIFAKASRHGRETAWILLQTVTMSEKQNVNVVPAPFAKRLDENGKAALEKAKKRKERKRMSKGMRKNMAVIVFFIVFVVLPTLAVGLYYFFIAADQYRVETRFSVRSATAPVSSGILSSLGLGLGGSSASDTYIILEYIHSREILERIDKAIGLRKMYRKPKLDFYARLPEDVTFETFAKYWRSMVHVGLDHTSHIITVETFAFTPEDTKKIAAAILSESERMINQLSLRAREDAVAYAQNEVRKAEMRLKKVRQKFLRFRSDTQQIDPAKQAQVQVVIIGKLEGELANLKTRLSEARSYLSENAPTIIYLKNRMKALQSQIREEKSKLGSKGRKTSSSGSRDIKGQSLSTTLSEYEALVVEREFAEKFYLSTLSGLEQARLLASRQQRYLATFVSPYLPDESLYPKRVRNTVFVFLALTLLWGLIMLMVQSIRDRM